MADEEEFVFEPEPEDDDPVLSFGQYKGLRISEVPRGYLRYVYDNFNHSDYPNVITAIEKLL